MSVPPASCEGGLQEMAMLQAAMSEAHIILHAPPDFPPTAETLGICGVSTQNADQNKYGWMVADFLHWKMLFHGVGEKRAQKWLSSLNIAEFLKGVDGVDMINDGTIQKVVGLHEEDIGAIASDNEGFATAFLEQLTASSVQAVERQTMLVVMVFAPITPEQDICVDFGGKKIFLTAERLQRTINDAVGNVQLPVMLVTPSPFTGGWLCRPSFINWPASCPTPEVMLRTIAKACGGAFADRFIHSFTERKTPLMTEAQREKVKYDDPMPLRPTPLQTECLHKLQRQIHESLEHRLSMFAQDHAFILQPGDVRSPSSFSDTWMEYGSRQGRSINFWANRWASPRPAISDAHRFDFLGEAFGGTRDSQFFHLKYLAAIELETYPGDWDRQVGGITRELLTSFSQRIMPSPDDAKRVFDTIEFRVSSMTLAHIIIKAFNLPLPDGVKGRYWHDKMDVSDDYYTRLQWAFGEALSLFDQAAVLPSEKRHEFKNVRFWRAARWVSAAIALRFENGSREDIVKFIKKDVAQFIAKIRDMQENLLLEDRAVTRAGQDWIAALGLGGEVQTPIAKVASPKINVVQQSATSIGFEGSNKQKTGASLLAAQAAPWPTQALKTTSPAKSPAAVFAEALARNNIQHCSNIGESSCIQPAAKSEYHGTHTVASSTTPVHATKVEVEAPRNGPHSLNGNARFETPAKTSSAFNGADLEYCGNRSAGNSIPQEKPADTVLRSHNQGGDRGATIDPNTSFSLIDDSNTAAWDKILGPSNNRHGAQENRQGQVASTKFETSEDLIGLEAKETANHVANSRRVVDEPVAPSSSETVAAFKNPAKQEAELLAEEAMAKMKTETSASLKEFLMEVLEKATEHYEKEQQKKASSSNKGALDPSKQASYPVHGRSEITVTSGLSRGISGTNSDWHPATAGTSVQQTGGDVEAAGGFAVKPSTQPSQWLEKPSGVTTGQLCAGPLDGSLGSLAVRDSMPSIAPVTENPSGMGGSQGTTNDVKNIGAAPPTAAQETAGSQAGAHPLQLAEEDFWTRAGIQW